MTHCNESKTKQDLLLEKLKGQSLRGRVVDASGSVIGESAGYRVMESTPDSWQQRVIDEKTELDTKIDKLATFLLTPRNIQLSGEDYKDLIDQHNLMLKYSEVLRRRISRFTNELTVCAP